MDFNGKVVLITGAASGIGASCARVFAAKGAQLSLVDLNGSWLREVADKCTQLSPNKSKILQTVGDLTNKDFREKNCQRNCHSFRKIRYFVEHRWNMAGRFCVETESGVL